MIALFGRDDYSVLGIATILDIEKIPYRRVSKLEPGRSDLLVVATSDLSPAEIASLERQPALVLNGGTLFARQVFGAANPAVTNKPCTIALDQPVWPTATAQLGRSFGKSALQIPLAPVCETTQLGRGVTLASLSSRVSQPAIVQLNRCVWSTVDLGAAFANLLTESYLPEHKRHTSSSASKQRARRAAEGIYYLAPAAFRRLVQRRSYAALERQLSTQNGRVSEYPIDATGWLLIELVKSLIKLTADALVRLERWPAPYRAAATLTHDIEPRRYAYTAGLDRLLRQVTALGHPPTFGLVAAASDKYLTHETRRRLRKGDALCHGLEHRGEPVLGRVQVAMTLRDARTRLERQLQRPVTGYRSPRLDRSADLVWALDRNEFRWDSSYPDVDRENLRHFGGGVRLNLPYRPLVEGDPQTLRPSRCLELPLTAPDCIQPLFAGHSVSMLRAAVEQKAAFVRQTGGLYVALVHGGVFGAHDSAVRGKHLDFVSRQLRHADTWLTGMSEIADWWCGREALRLGVEDGAIHIRNEGPTRMAGVRVVVEQTDSETTYAVPALDPGTRATIALPDGISPAA